MPICNGKSCERYIGNVADHRKQQQAELCIHGTGWLEEREHCETQGSKRDEMRKVLCMLQDAPCSTTCTMLSKAARAYAPIRGAEGSTDVPNWIGLGGKERCDVRSASRGLHAKSNVVPGGRHVGSHATRCSKRNRGGAG